MLIGSFRIRTRDEYFRKLLSDSEDIVCDPDVETLWRAREDEVSGRERVLVRGGLVHVVIKHLRTSIVSHWLVCVTWYEYYGLIGWFMSRDTNTAL